MASTISNLFVSGTLKNVLSNTDTSSNFADLNLTTDQFLYLKLSAPVGKEIIKVAKFNNTLMLVRGQEGTVPLNFPIGSCYETWVGVDAVTFIVNQE